MDSEGRSSFSAFGPNAWLVDEMYERYLQDENSVSPSWREFFRGYRHERGSASSRIERVATAARTGEVRVPPPAEQAPAPTPGKAPGELPPDARLLSGAQAALVRNMEASLSVPTATSVRTVPAKLLADNRWLMNQYLSRASGMKVSFTHIIAYAVTRAIAEMPEMTATYEGVADGNRPAVRLHPDFGLGIAVDHRGKDGSRSLVVVVIKEAASLSFDEFVAHYEDLLRRLHAGRLGADDVTGAVVTVTNPGMIGTSHSVPRLMRGQAVIVGVGAIAYPAAFSGASPETLARLGVSPEITFTSTYDHRVIQGAASGEMLARIERLLLGQEGFYEQIFSDMDVPYPPFAWSTDLLEVQDDMAEKSAQARALVNMFRVRGHLMADLDPLKLKKPKRHSELDLSRYGLTIWDLDRRFHGIGIGKGAVTLREALSVLYATYCSTTGIEFMHMMDPAAKDWVIERFEQGREELGREDRIFILDRLTSAEAFEAFLHSRYVGQKRFGLEGGESAIPALDAILEQAADDGADTIVLGMAHRGRLNVLANVVGKSLEEIFQEFEGHLDPESVQGSGDVKYHKGAEGAYRTRAGRELKVVLASNPSHLESVDPVVEGMARAYQDLLRHQGLEAAASACARIVPVLIHGDAAFAGQGVVAETLNLSELQGYRTGGTIHLVINNQLGFTTPPEAGRSSVYATDVAKMVQAPIFHVNGDDPEAVWRAAKAAVAFRSRFGRDVVIDLVCYRLHGHNELDDPSYTQPIMYKAIERHRSVRKLYTEKLVKAGVITLEEAERHLEAFAARLAAALEEVRRITPSVAEHEREELKLVFDSGKGPDEGQLAAMASYLHEIPSGFHIHPRLEKVLSARAALAQKGEVDWSLGEALAFVSLLAEGRDVRLAGQDTRRGTFSHRHGVWVDYETGTEYSPIERAAEMVASQSCGRLYLYDSSLSEFAALGFEYGYSLVNTEALVAWEAQFGDFANGAQVVIDNYISSAFEKWGQESSLVLLLPHGYEGQGPEHSSARLERFLELCAGNNMVVAQPTTASQFYHLLRSQVRHRPRRPAVVLTPKSLLRARSSRSPLRELASGAFRPVIDDPEYGGTAHEAPDSHAAKAGVRRVVVASGKVGVEALEARAKGQLPPGIAVVRLELIYPVPVEELREAIASYEQAEEVVFLQEEPVNMGAAGFLKDCLREIGEGLSKRFRIVARPASASPATGSFAIHQKEQQELLQRVAADLS